MKVKTDYKGSRVFTAGKEYTVIKNEGNTAFYIKDDFGEEHFCLFYECAYLKGGDWTIVDGEEDLPVSKQTNTGTISLRDHFAGLAMQALTPVYWDMTDSFENANNLVKCLAESAYEHADAMLKAREGQ